MKGSLKRLSSFAGKSSRDKSPQSIVLNGDRDLTATQKLQKSIQMKKTILRKKIGSIPDVDSIPIEFEQYKATLKILFTLFDENSKFMSSMHAATTIEEQSGKQIAAALSQFRCQLSKSDASRALGDLIVEYCKIQTAIEMCRGTTFTPLWHGIRVRSDSYIVGLQSVKQQADHVFKAHLELIAAVTDITQIISETVFERSISVQPSEIEGAICPFDEKIDHVALYRLYLNYQKCKKNYHSKLENAMAAFEDTFVQKEIEIAAQIQSLFNAQKVFFINVTSKFEIIEQQYNIRTAFEESEKIQSKRSKQRLDQQKRDQMRVEDAKWHPLLEFFMSVEDGILCLANDQEEEQKLLVMIITAFHAYNRAVPWLTRLISAEVERTSEPSTLLRGNIFVTKLLLAYMRFTCGDLLFTPLRDIITEAISNCNHYEVDPKKIPEGDNVEDNLNNLINLTKGFLEVIFTTEMPIPLREILSYLREETDKKFPGKGTNFAGAYVFLRFICPALVFPTKSGILPPDFEIPKNGNRCLMLTSKALQNLANGVDFREEYMGRMNEMFLHSNIPVIQEFFVKISRAPDGEPDTNSSELLLQVNQKELPVLYQLLVNNMTVVAEKLEENGDKQKQLELAATLGRLSVVHKA